MTHDLPAGQPLVEALDAFRVPVGNQAIELQQVRYPGGGVPLLRLRIREGSRFTVFDIDAVTAQRWAQCMTEWAQPTLAAASANPSGDAH